MTQKNRRARATVVIASRIRPFELDKCLQSVSRGISAEDEIIVVDSASDDPASIRGVVAGYDAELFRLESTGAARARNWGIRQAKGEIIAFTDDDALVGPEWLDALTKGFSDPGVSVVIGPVFENGTEPARLLFPSTVIDTGIERYSLSRSDPRWFEKLLDGAFGFGANIAVRRSVFERHGLFRESLGAGAPIGGDENYFLLALVENGGLIVNEPSARVYHPRQSNERLQEMRNERLAYLLYILLTRPHLRLPMITYMLRKVSRRNRNSVSPPISSPSILRQLVSAPKLLMRAFRIDRSESGRRA